MMSDVLSYLLFASVAVRLAANAVEQGFRPFLQGALLAAFLLLCLLQPVVHRRLPALLQPLLALAAAVVTGLLLTEPSLDYYAVLYLVLSLSVHRFLPLRHSPYWLAGLCVLLSAVLFVAYGLAEGLSYIPTYIAGVLFIGLYGRASRRAEEARARSEELAGRLQEANRLLKKYAERAEEVAAAQERSRLARELHDAVTQTVFSMNLTAEGARLACEADPRKVPGMLDRLQELGRDALSEMRALVDELRPRSVAELGLVGSLRKHLAMRRRRDGLAVRLEVSGEERGGEAVQEALFRTAQEALNNVARHAGVKEAEVELAYGEREVCLRVRDAGRGFAPASVPQAGPGPAGVPAEGGAASTAGRESFGLVNMRERVEALGGSFRLVSAPGAGTAVEARVPLESGRRG
jgi:signal transduction histidine kinase